MNLRAHQARRRRLLLAALGAGGSALLGGCGAAPLERYREQTPALDLADYFRGPLSAQGLFVDRFGDVRRRFVVRMVGEWQGGDGVLTEDFLYDDGERSQRIWRIRSEAPQRWSGRADDVVGAARGEASGSAVRWQYRLLLPVQGRTWEVDVDDWMHRIDARHVLNRARFSKCGVTLGDVQIAFQRA